MSTDTLLSLEESLEKFDPAMGLEVHVELNTNTKMFCGCPAVFGGEPNSQLCPTCLGLPGAMPVVNAQAVESAIRIGPAPTCALAEWCPDRKCLASGKSVSVRVIAGGRRDLK